MRAHFTVLTLWCAAVALALCGRVAAATTAPPPPYNQPFFTNDQLTAPVMSEAEIRAFLTSKGSYFRQAVPDVDSTAKKPILVDAAKILAGACSTYSISPRLVLALVEKECSGVTRAGVPSNLGFLMGVTAVGATPVPRTARDQLAGAVRWLRRAMDVISSTGTAPAGWKVGTMHKTEDGVYVTPANPICAILFAYNPVVGPSWGGNMPAYGGNSLLVSIYSRFFGGPAQPPTIVADLTDLAIKVDQSPAFAVTATGTAPITYTWTRNGNPIPGATGPLLVDRPAALSDNGAVYQVTLRNAAGTARSRVAVLKVSKVQETIAKLMLSPSKLTLSIGQWADVNVIAYNASGQTQPTPALTWSITGDSRVQSGTVVAGVTAGRYVLTATGGGRSGTAEVTILKLASLPVTNPSPADGAVDVSPLELTLAFQYSVARGTELAIELGSTPTGSEVDLIGYGGVIGTSVTFHRTFKAGMKYYWRVKLRDAAGNIVTGPTWSFTTKVASPLTVRINNPPISPYVVTEPRIALAGTATGISSLPSVFVSNDRGGSVYTAGAFNWTVNALALSVGRNTLLVTATDSAGNTGSATVLIDYVPPVTALIPPSNLRATRVDANTVVVQFSINATNFEATQIEQGLNGTWTHRIWLDPVTDRWTFSYPYGVPADVKFRARAFKQGRYSEYGPEVGLSTAGRGTN